jgi:hypothetical protein
MVLVAGVAKKVCEASPQDSTRHEGVQLAGHELGQRASAGLVGPLLLEGQQGSARGCLARNIARLGAHHE